MPARDDQRRQILRELHDGIGPTLVAVALGLETTSKLLGASHATGVLLAKLHDELQEAITEIRRLGHELRPLVLDRTELVPAIRDYAYALASRYGDRSESAERLEITIDAPETLPKLPAGVELAAYRIVCEALANVARHANARTCLVRLWLDGGDLRIEVVDDGVGLPPGAGARRGIGLWSMRERAADLGGDCIVEANRPRDPASCGAGTRVFAALPLPQPGPNPPNVR